MPFLRFSPTRALKRRFSVDARLDWWLVMLFVGINGLVLVNAVLHNPFVGYDALDHLSYIDVLSHGRLPGPDDSTEFFAAPLPYALPALLYAIGTDRWGVVIKAAQLLNVAWSIGLTLALIRLCRLIAPSDRSFARWTLLLLGTLPVYYKTFAFVRGEPLEAFLAVVVIERSLGIFVDRGAGRRPWIVLGAAVGLLMLAKQWGAFAAGVAGVFLIWGALVRVIPWRRVIRGGAAAGVVAIAISGWFYVSLYERFGALTTFNQPPAPRWTPANRPGEFYTGLGLSTLFTDPVRDSFAIGKNTLLWPVLYADTWGDYWCYWTMSGRDSEDGSWASGQRLMDLTAGGLAATNRLSMARYLGRVNVAAIAPTLVVMAGVILGWMRVRRMWTRRTMIDLDTAALGLAAAVCGVTVAGYLWLLVGYPALDVKASYLLHIYPFAALLGAFALGRVRYVAPRALRILQALVLLAALHNAPAFITHFAGR